MTMSNNRSIRCCQKQGQQAAALGDLKVLPKYLQKASLGTTESQSELLQVQIVGGWPTETIWAVLE